MPGKGSVAVYMEANPSEGPMIGLLRAREEHPRHCCSQTRRTKLVLAAVAILAILAGVFLGLGLHFYLQKGECVAEQIPGASRSWATGGRRDSGRLPTGHMSSQLWVATWYCHQLTSPYDCPSSNNFNSLPLVATLFAACNSTKQHRLCCIAHTPPCCSHWPARLSQ
jgi:hypothetical protein